MPENQEGLEEQLEKMLLHRVKQELKNNEVDMKDENVDLSHAQQVKYL